MPVRPCLVRSILAALGATLALTALGLAAVSNASPARAAPADQPQPACPPADQIPNGAGNLPEFTDSNVSVFVGGTMATDDDAVESEGVNVILGNATLGANLTNVGSVGVGSQIVPAPSSDMLLVGGDLAVKHTNGLDVGTNVYDQNGTPAGGNVRVGGTITGVVNQPPANEVKSGDSTAASDWNSFGTTMNSASSDLAGQTPTSAGAVNGAQLRFTGDGTGNLQVFTVPASALDSVKEVYFTNIGKNAEGGYAPIAINVTGGDAINFAPNFWEMNGGGQLSLTHSDFGNVASAVLWNFADTTSLTLGHQDQFMGSVLAPQPSGNVTANTSTNGRLYVGGDLYMSGTGVEHHNYAWTGGLGFECKVHPEPTGGFSVAKVVAGDSGAATSRFSGTWVCDAANADGQDSGVWSVAGGGSVSVTGFPVGTSCTVAEDPVTDVNGTWVSSLAPADGKVTIGAGTVVAVTVTNTFHEVVPQTGGFSVAKVVAGDSGAATSRFGGTWVCDAANADGQDSGVWSVAGGGSVSVTGFPVGTSCTVAEDPVTDVNGTWVSSLAPADGKVTIGAGTVVAVTVTNAFHEVVPQTGGFSVAKVVAGDSGAATSRFGGTWVCDAANADGQDSGVWSVAGGGSVSVTGFPVGTSCTVAEDPVTDVNGTWVSSLAPADGKVTIGAGTVVAVTVTNTFTPSQSSSSPPAPSPTDPNSSSSPGPSAAAGSSSNGAGAAGAGGELASTGFDVAGGIALAVVVLGVGVALTAVVRRRGEHA